MVFADGKTVVTKAATVRAVQGGFGVAIDAAAQVYGGAVSLVIGPYLLSYNSGNSMCYFKGTNVSGLSILLNTSRITRSHATTSVGIGSFNPLKCALANNFSITYEFRSIIRLQRASRSCISICAVWP